MRSSCDNNRGNDRDDSETERDDEPERKTPLLDSFAGDDDEDEVVLSSLQRRCVNALAKDWHQFDMALGRYGRLAGEVFKPVQGGIYRTSHIAQCIEVANQIGLQGATQSSWGPTVCAIAKDDEHALWCYSRLLSALPCVAISITRAANYPARVDSL